MVVARWAGLDGEKAFAYTDEQRTPAWRLVRLGTGQEGEVMALKPSLESTPACVYDSVRY